MAGCRHAPRTIGQGADAFTGVVHHTGNPQVAEYTVRPHSAAQVTIEFGPTSAYGLKTWTVSAEQNHPATIFVAGMRAQTRYRMRALVRFADGTQVDDVDHTFRTGHYKRSMIPPITVQTFGTPQAGVELLNPSIRSWYEALVTDLQGNVLWAYNYSDRQSSFDIQVHRYVHAAYLTLVNGWRWVKHLFGAKVPGHPKLWDRELWKPVPPKRRFATIINPIKLMPNGNFLMVIGLASHALLDSPDGAPPPHTTIALREVNLAGRTIRNLNMKELNQELKAIGYRGPTLEMVHHDVAILPNGHMIMIANGTRDYTNLPGYPGTTRVIGDVLVDLDPNFRPVWTWNEFDHLDVNHHPIDFPDWTHTNAVVYTKDDGNLIVSMRAQHEVIKIDYDNGKGAGRILWRLGPYGDLRLIGGTAPTDWNYGQHDPVIFGSRDAGVFDLGMMDNGYGRIMPDGKVCGTKGAPPCYSTALVFRIDEKAKTATIIFRDKFPPKLYSLWGGSVQPLANGDMEIDLCSVGHDSDVYEVTQTAIPRTVWHMHVSETNLYRTERLGSLYPGVQWR
jgi:arylsulfate sulfotransferase